MIAVLARLARVPLTVAAVWAMLAVASPLAMSQYRPFVLVRGIGSAPRPASPFAIFNAPAQLPSVAETYKLPLTDVILEATLRSVVLLVGVAAFALTVGVLLGIVAALLRRRPASTVLLLGTTSIVAAIPSFFLAYFLQMAIIFIGGAAGHSILPVFGFGLDGHLVLPLLALAAPAVAMTAQLTAIRMGEVYDADFVNTANAKGLLPSWIVRVHILPHVLPVSLEAVGSGLRVSVASLPIVEYILQWNGIGLIALQAVALGDATAFAACGVVLAALFSFASLLLDLRPRHLA